MNITIRLLIILAGISCSLQSFATSTVYEISKGKNKLYLAGTIHMLREKDFPPPAEFAAAYQQAQKIYFETDIQKAKNPEFGQRFAQAMILPNNTTLKDVLNENVWAALQAYATKSQYPLSQTMMFNSAMVSILVVMGESKKMGVGEGIDVFYDKAARTENKFIGELENGDDVIAYMQKFAQEDANKIIESTLSDLEEMPSEFDKMIASWRSGDLNALDKEFSLRMRKETPLVYQALVVERNQKWLPQIEAMLATPEIEMVLVGSLHLSGSDGLLALLKKAGYKVKPYQIKNNLSE
jgi:uncharacterized protein YbaP (TraB family)